MSQILIIGDQEDVLEIYSVNLSTYVGADIIRKASLSEAKGLLEHHPGIHGIITFDKIGDEDTAYELYHFLHDDEKYVPMIVVGEEDRLEDKVIFHKSKTDIRSLVRAVAQLLGVTAKDMAQKVVPDYFAINIHYFLNLQTSPSDIYLCIKKQSGADQYVKRFHKDEVLARPEMEKYLERGVSDFFIPAEERLAFVAKTTETMIGLLADENLSSQSRVQATESVMRIVEEEANREPTDTETIEALSKAAIESSLKVVKDAPKLSKLLEMLLKDTSSFRYRNAQLCTYLCSYVIKNSEWGSEEQVEKMGFVSFFHDIVLSSDDMALVRNESELLDSEHLNDSEKERVAKHAQMAAELVRDFPRVPIGADIIIQQHHGTLSGQGFAKAFTNSISPLAIVFIVVEHFSYLVLNNDEDELDIPAIVDELNRVYTKSKYRKVTEILANVEL